jgi:Flavodoxin-like fold
MRVLTVYAHHNPRSFCHAVLEHFTQGLKDAGHESEVVDLYVIKFNPVYGDRDSSFFAHESVPLDLWDEAALREQMVASGGGLAGTVALALLIMLLPIRRAVRFRPGDALRYA